MRIGNATLDSRKGAGEALLARADEIAAEGKTVEAAVVGKIRGFPIEARYYEARGEVFLGVRHSPAEELADAGTSADPVGLIRKLEYALDKPNRYVDHYRSEIVKNEKQVAALREQLAGVKEFAEQDKLMTLEAQIAEMEGAILADSEAAEKARNEVEGPKESWFIDEPVGSVSISALDGTTLPARQRQLVAWFRNLIGQKVTNRETGARKSAS